MKSLWLTPIAMYVLTLVLISPGHQANALQERSVQVKYDDTQTTYTNFSRVTGTPEEVVLDFGLNVQVNGKPVGPVKIEQRVVMNYYTAKRLQNAINITLKRHESVFGEIETNVQNRIKNRPQID